MTAGDLNVGAAFESAYRGLPDDVTPGRLAAAGLAEVAAHQLPRAFTSGRQA